MGNRENLAKELAHCMDVDEICNGYIANCHECSRYGDSTPVCKSLLNDIYSELLCKDETSYGIKIPGSHIDRVMRKFQFYISQLQVCEEECSELIKAISKSIRITQGTTELTKEEARAIIIEEMTHVAIALHMLQKIYDIKQEEIDDEIAKKAAELDKEGL